MIFERAGFNRRSQRPDESVEQFITSLYSLADSCDYGSLLDEMIRDRIVVGIRDQSLSERLQLDARLTLESAKTLFRQREAVHEQQSLRDSPKQELSVDFVKGKPPRGTSFKPADKYQSTDSKKCSRCGKAPHPRHLCPAKEAICHKCRKRDHYSLQCRSKAIAEVKQVPQFPEAGWHTVRYSLPYCSWGGATSDVVEYACSHQRPPGAGEVRHRGGGDSDLRGCLQVTEGPKAAELYKKTVLAR